ncbi:erythronolide synthase [Nocardiopsis sp. TSRI0078]|uniref:type I polyketide synthase n=1 Tax=unclassified Nocardiopsis TaxID=2649073 RepID=UPI00093C98A3|nr:type I polyketide synthase [Nocardiopsis sp. TSRI0078]OKI23492.1 erythronolide synthase [Nocardiopsis sp. TSRI0078]
MKNTRIAVVGIGLRYPDADSPLDLWDNVLAGRRAFRRLPNERMNLDDYWSQDPSAEDRFYSDKAAVLRGFSFDRVRYRVSGSSFRSTDMTHWLALDTMSRALEDAGFPEGEGLPRRSTGVVIGNSLTGEFSRANTMRLRWPYVRRTVASALLDHGWGEEEADAFLSDLEESYKAPFPRIDEDTLAGGLSNTIAGRVCNHFDLGGGGYTVDGACSSSLLSVATAATALAEGDLDAALAGGVDLSIDPFEVIGFAKTGALATGEMKVYDKDSNGFWPGEGSGALVLMREEDAIAQGKRVYAVITGWAVSSDGRGGITRPEESGHRLALERAYARAGYGIETVGYFEGHGTGTALGDATELAALSGARSAADPSAPPAALGSVKANFGHTKAAAGVAGLIKAILTVYHQVIPPGTGHHDPHPLLEEESAALYVPDRALPWPEDRPVRAGVSAMGFGGVNTHVTVETAADRGGPGITAHTRELVSGRQDAELLVVEGGDTADVRRRLEELSEILPRLSYAELTDLAHTLAGRTGGGPARAAVVASSPEAAADAVRALITRIDAGEREVLSPARGIFLAHRSTPPTIRYLFPGQGSGDGGPGALRRRFGRADEVLASARLREDGDQAATEIAQPRIVAGSLAALAVLDDIGVRADGAVGHSLGELTALHWAGAIDAAGILDLAAARGRAMAETGGGDGAMAGLAASPERVEALVADEAELVVAGYNGPEQTVVSGSAEAVERVCRRARAEGITATRVNVSHAFHSPLVAPATEEFGRRLDGVRFAPLSTGVVSTVTGAPLDADTDTRALLREQIVLPVRFHEAVVRAAEGADLLVEVGPGRVLTGLAAAAVPDVPAVAVDTDSTSLVPFLRAVAAAYALGAPVDVRALFTGRLVRELPDEFEFLASPCETAPSVEVGRTDGRSPAPAAPEEGAAGGEETADTLELLRALSAERVELPVSMVGPDTRPLDDLHLSSITVGQIVNEVTRRLGLPPMGATSGYATSSLGELAETIDTLARTADGGEAAGEAPGAAPWVRAFEVAHVDAPPPRPRPAETAGRGQDGWSVYASPGHPLAEPLREALSDHGGGVLLCLPADGGAHLVGTFLDAARAALAAGPEGRFVVVQGRRGASGVARTLHQELPGVTTTLVTLHDPEPATGGAREEAVRRVVAEVAATSGFAEARYDAEGRRTVPVLRATLPGRPDDGEAPLGPDDVLLVTGGGKGITAECALSLATEYGVGLALLGRASEEEDAELAANLERMSAAGVRHRYERADVTRPEEVLRAVGALQEGLGPVTAVLHGAGRNEPTAVGTLTEPAFRRTLAPKTDGLETVLGALDPARLRLLVTFGSIIGRAGLRGEAHYSTANDWLTEMTVEYGREHPHTRVLALEWSVWSGAGMGERLGVVEALMRDGITPVSAEEGIDVLHQVLRDPSAGPVLVVSGRTGGMPTLTTEEHELPLGRFLDRVLVHYPGVELVTEAVLSSTDDPYLDDHLLDGDMLFPAVVGMEAMAQVAAAVSGHDGPPVLERGRFLRPVAVRPGETTTIRVAALVRDGETVEVVVRSEETGYDADHFRAVLSWRGTGPEEERPAVADATTSLPRVPIDPGELYGSVLFQGKRFQRLLAYRRVSARHVVAELSTVAPADWFGAFLPQERVLADPGVRDAAMHVLQACVPDGTLLPEGVDRIVLARAEDQEADCVLLDARERSQDGDSYVYDVDVRDSSGALVERWEGLRLRAVRRSGGAGPWVPALLGSHLERELEQVLGGSRAVVVDPDPSSGPAGDTEERRARTELAVSRALNRPVRVRHRPDGRPEAEESPVSASHGAGVTLAVAGAGRIACDVEAVAERSEEEWSGLLGRGLVSVRDLVAEQAGESAHVAATRLWSALECLRKSGGTGRSLTLEEVRPHGWVVLSSGDARVATWTTTLNANPDPVVFAVLSGEER